MGSRSKGPHREIVTFTYKPRLGKMSRPARKMARARRRDTYSRALETETASWWSRKKSRRTARGKRKVAP